MRERKKSLDEAVGKSAGKLGDSLNAVKPPRPEAGGKVPAPRAAEGGAEKKGPRNTAVSFTREEYEFLKEVFEAKARGMKVATGVKMAALYVAERLDAGIFSMSRAGIFERR